MDCCVCLTEFNASNCIPYVICSNVHSVCSNCKDQLQECPLCRSSIVSNPKRNHDLLNLIELLSHKDSIPTISPNDLSLDLNSAPIGEGGCGKVHRALWNNSAVAVKVMTLTSEGSRKIDREVSMMIQLNHPLVLRVFGTVKLDRHVGIVMELADDTLPFPSSLNNTTLKRAMDIVKAVMFLHARNIVHMDIKPSNILLSNGNIKVADFGTSKTISSTTIRSSLQVYTPKYAASEVFDNIVHFSSDVYSIGILLYEILCDKLAFENLTPAAVLRQKLAGVCPPFLIMFHSFFFQL
ncbi:hypothetical protein GEMRC1_000709 [Eukaryota sp. GEM-RC1]